MNRLFVCIGFAGLQQPQKTRGGGRTGSTSSPRGLYLMGKRCPAGHHAAAALHAPLLAASAARLLIRMDIVAESSAQVPRASTCERVRPALMMPKTRATSSSGQDVALWPRQPRLNSWCGHVAICRPGSCSICRVRMSKFLAVTFGRIASCIASCRSYTPPLGSQINQYGKVAVSLAQPRKQCTPTRVASVCRRLAPQSGTLFTDNDLPASLT